MRFPALLSSVAAIAALFSPVSAKRLQVNGFAAKANGEIITQNELMIRLAPDQSLLMARFPPRGENQDRGPRYRELLNARREIVLNQLIDNAIIYSLYKDRVNLITDQVVEDEIEKLIRIKYAGDRSLFKKYLKATDLSYHQFKEQQRKEILVSVIKGQQFGDPPPPSEAEMRNVYKKWALQNRDRQKDVATYEKIYLLTQDRFNPSVSRESQLKLAEEIVQQLRSGADFAELAKKHSRDSMAAEGGLWKDVPRTDLNPDFGALLFDFESNEKVIGPIEYGPGLTIFRVVSRKYGPASPYSEVKDLMKRIVNNEKKNSKFEAWMKKQRAKVPIQRIR